MPKKAVRTELLTFAPHTTYAVLASQTTIATELGDLKLADVSDATVVIFGEELRLRVRLFTTPKIEVVLKKTRKSANAVPGECRIGNTMYPLITHKEGGATLAPLLSTEGYDEPLDGCTIASMLADIRPYARCAGGIHMEVHPPTPSLFHEPLPDEEEIFHLFLSTVPMNDVYMHYPQEFFGLEVLTSVGYYAALKASRGRGIVLTDGKNAVAQIVGNNIYILFNPLKMVEVGEEKMRTIFRKTLALIFSHILAREWADEFVEMGGGEDGLCSTEDIMALIDTHAAGTLAELKKKIVKKMNAIREAEEELRLKLESLADLRRMHKLLVRDEFYEKPLRAHLLGDYERMRAHPLVSGMQIIEKCGLEVATRIIYITYDGVCRRIGRFMIRFNMTGGVVIWCRESYHPKGVPHPHISPWNGPCFGNATATIREAVAAYEYGDALEYVLTWLTEGYTPELVIHNHVEEWPIDNTSEGATQ